MTPANFSPHNSTAPLDVLDEFNDYLKYIGHYSDPSAIPNDHPFSEQPSLLFENGLIPQSAYATLDFVKNVELSASTNGFVDLESHKDLPPRSPLIEVSSPWTSPTMSPPQLTPLATFSSSAPRSQVPLPQVEPHQNLHDNNDDSPIPTSPSHIDLSPVTIGESTEQSSSETNAHSSPPGSSQTDPVALPQSPLTPFCDIDGLMSLSDRLSPERPFHLRRSGRHATSPRKTYTDLDDSETNDRDYNESSDSDRRSREKIRSKKSRSPAIARRKPGGHAKRFTCQFPGCGETFGRKGDAFRHESISPAHKDDRLRANMPEPSSAKCQNCGQVLSRRDALDRHQLKCLRRPKNTVRSPDEYTP